MLYNMSQTKIFNNMIVNKIKASDSLNMQGKNVKIGNIISGDPIGIFTINIAANGATGDSIQTFGEIFPGFYLIMESSSSGFVPIGTDDSFQVEVITGTTNVGGTIELVRSSVTPTLNYVDGLKKTGDDIVLNAANTTFLLDNSANGKPILNFPNTKNGPFWAGSKNAKLRITFKTGALPSTLGIITVRISLRYAAHPGPFITRA
jgi:hypothetical protein